MTTVSEAMFVCYRSKLTSSLTKKLFLTLTAIFLLIRTAHLAIPWPFTLLTYLLFSNQMPRYFLFLGWQMLALWLASALLSSSSKSRISVKCLTVVFIVLFIILLITSIIYCVAIDVCFPLTVYFISILFFHFLAQRRYLIYQRSWISHS